MELVLLEARGTGLRAQDASVGEATGGCSIKIDREEAFAGSDRVGRVDQDGIECLTAVAYVRDAVCEENLRPRVVEGIARDRRHELATQLGDAPIDLDHDGVL